MCQQTEGLSNWTMQLSITTLAVMITLSSSTSPSSNSKCREISTSKRLLQALMTAIRILRAITLVQVKPSCSIIKWWNSHMGSRIWAKLRVLPLLENKDPTPHFRTKTKTFISKICTKRTASSTLWATSQGFWIRVAQMQVFRVI